MDSDSFGCFCLDYDLYISFLTVEYC